ncbi:MAG: pyridoxal kinase PdxY [Kiloniellales bacterium]|nr:pyridoxal kinase PdxY [Kiloniellales bacterium]
MAILSIQSHVAYGHVGNAAVVFLLQRLGLEVWPVMTVQLSNHRGYESSRGRAFSAAELREVILGIGERGVLADCQAVLSGYLGEAAVGDVVLEALAAVRAANPTAVFCCDPVMGDQGRGLYVQDEVPDFFRDRAVPAADILTPNLFELAQLSGRQIEGLEDALEAARGLLERGPRIVLVTSLRHPESAYDEIGMLAVTGDAAYRVATPRLPLDPAPNGAGDSVAALFLGHLLQGCSVEAALANAAAGIFAILSATGIAESRELQIVAAQEALLKPSVTFEVERIG